MVQARVDIDTTDFVIGENPQALREDAATILTDALRVAVLAQYTLMGKLVATNKWTPFTDETETTGEASYFGIYMGPDIAAADLVAGDVVDVPIIYSGLKFDEAKLVIENSKDLDTVIETGTIAARTVRSALAVQDLIAQPVDTFTNYENA
jgi:hypothetical protein